MKRHFLLLCVSVFILSLVGTASAECTVEQTQWNSSSHFAPNYGQGFTAPCNGILKSIVVYTHGIENVGVPAATIEIYDGLDGAVDEPILAEYFDSEADGPALTGHIYLFSEKVALTASSPYSFVFDTAGADWWPIGMDSDKYPGGTQINNNTSKQNNRDLLFHVIIEDPSSQCAWSQDEDDDVDGMDLAILTDYSFDETELADFASQFGKTSCPD